MVATVNLLFSNICKKPYIKRIITRSIASAIICDVTLKIKSSSRGISINNSKKNKSDAIKIIIKKNARKRIKYNDSFDLILPNKTIDKTSVTKPTERQKIKKNTNK